jgi:alkylhydroperoxidase family enzyme
VGHNVELGRALGLTVAQIDLLTGDDWRDSELFSDKEKAAIWWADEVTNLRAKQNKPAFLAMEKHFTTRQIVELTFICGMWNLSGRVAEALHLVVEPPGKRIEFQLEEDSVEPSDTL